MNEQPSQRISELPTGEGVNILKQCAAFIQKFNRQHGLGVKIVDMMIGQLTSSQEVVEKEDQELHKIRERILLLGVGLERYHDSTVTLLPNLQGEPTIRRDDLHPERMHVIIVEPARVLMFLSSLDCEMLKKDKKLHDAINMLLNDIENQMFEWSIRIEKKEALRNNLIQQGDQIVQTLKNLSCNTTRLELLLANAQRGTLAEYRYLEQAQCFLGVNEGGFGPSVWHTDITPEFYQERWQGAIDAIHLVNHNPRALPLIQRAVENLLASAQSAIADIQERIKNPPKNQDSHYQAHTVELLSIAQTYRDLLNGLHRSLCSQSSRKTFD